jgi:hypothetical protein
MKKNPSSKAAEVIAFLKENTEETSVPEKSKVSNRKVRQKKKITKVRIRKAS